MYLMMIHQCDACAHIYSVTHTMTLALARALALAFPLLLPRLLLAIAGKEAPTRRERRREGSADAKGGPTRAASGATGGGGGAERGGHGEARGRGLGARDVIWRQLGEGTRVGERGT